MVWNNMAIEIVSKSERETPFWTIGIYYLSLFLFCLTIFGSAVLFYLNKRASNKIESLNSQIVELKLLEMEKKFRQKKEMIEDFQALLERHRIPSMFLGSSEGPFSQTKKLAALIHPYVQIVSLSINLEEPEVEISGTTKSLTTLAQQLMIFEQEPLVKDVSLSNFSVTKEGKLDFNIKLVFDPSVFALAE